MNNRSFIFYFSLNDKYLNEKKDKMHPEDLKNLETSIKVIDLYGLNYDSKNN